MNWSAIVPPSSRTFITLRAAQRIPDVIDDADNSVAGYTKSVMKSPKQSAGDSQGNFARLHLPEAIESVLPEIQSGDTLSLLRERLRVMALIAYRDDSLQHASGGKC